jgi:hypothetical protein
MSITIFNIIESIKEMEEEQDKMEKFQRCLKEYILKTFHNCLDQFGTQEHNKRLKTYLDEADPVIFKPLDFKPEKTPKLEPIKVTEEGFEEIEDIFKLSNEQFYILFNKQ